MYVEEVDESSVQAVRSISWSVECIAFLMSSYTGRSVQLHHPKLNDMCPPGGCYADQRSAKPNVFVLWGPPGTGKMRMAISMCRSHPYHKWSDWVYRNQAYIVIPDVDTLLAEGEVDYPALHRILDGDVIHTLMGKTQPLRCSDIIITAETEPCEWCDDGKPG